MLMEHESDEKIIKYLKLTVDELEAIKSSLVAEKTNARTN
jgi:hypothetical protein